MRKILFAIHLFFIFSLVVGASNEKKDININKGNIINKNVSIKGGRGSDFSLMPNKPIEIGITSFEK